MKRIRRWVLLAGVCAAFSTDLHALQAEPETSGRGRLSVRDPAETISPFRRLMPAEIEQIDTLFKNLRSDDFDIRRAAKEGLIALGPRALMRAQEHDFSKWAEGRAFVEAFDSEIALNYRGYLPASEQLCERLRSTCRFTLRDGETAADVLTRISAENGVRIVFPEKPAAIVSNAQQSRSDDDTVEWLLAMLWLPASDEVLNPFLPGAAPPVFQGIARGNVVLGATREQAKVLAIQEHVFERQNDDAVAALRELLGVEAEIVPGKDALRVRGGEGVLRVTARMLGMLKSAETRRQWPAFGDDARYRALAAFAHTPVPAFEIEGVEATRGLTRLRAHGVPVEVGVFSQPLVSRQPPLSLVLKRVPLGVGLYWVQRRVNTFSRESAEAEAAQKIYARVAVAYEMENERALVRVHLRPPASLGLIPVYNDAVGFCDVTALLAKVPVAVLRAHLSDELAAFGETDDFAVAIHGKKLFVRGTALLVRHAAEIVDGWIVAGSVKSSLRSDMERALSTPVAWNGAGLITTELLAKMTTVCGYSVLIEKQKGLAPVIALTADEAPLLPEGQHTPRALLDKLCEVGRATWRMEAGVIVLSALPPKEALIEP